MPEGNVRQPRRERPAESARRIALHQHQRSFTQHRHCGLCDFAHVAVWIVLSRAFEPGRGETIEPVIGRAQLPMLPGEYQQRRKAAASESQCYRLELDRFGTGSDNQNNATGQPSP
jgi:hypothetical protein